MPVKMGCRSNYTPYFDRVLFVHKNTRFFREFLTTHWLSYRSEPVKLHTPHIYFISCNSKPTTPTPQKKNFILRNPKKLIPIQSPKTNTHLQPNFLFFFCIPPPSPPSPIPPFSPHSLPPFIGGRGCSEIRKEGVRCMEKGVR